MGEKVAPAVQDMGGPLRGPGTRERLDSIDLVRGIVMVLMALDHARDFFTNADFDPINMAKTTPAYFFTRFVTHFCAPTFVFLAGTGAFLSGTRGKTRGQLAWFLLTRGLWLAFLEATLVRLDWNFNFKWLEPGVGTLWAIGWSMVALSGLVLLPTAAVAAIGILMIGYHNMLDGVRPEDFGNWDWVWSVLHVNGGSTAGLTKLVREITPAAVPDLKLGIGYPLVPWIGVMAAGYGLGALYLLDSSKRRPQLLGLGLTLIAAFVVLRYSNLYGDKAFSDDKGTPLSGPWSVQERGPIYTVCSFLNCTKYPPSLVYLLMTLGPTITALGLFDGMTPGPLGRFLLVFGRVPLFFYLLHLPLTHGLACAWVYYRHGEFHPWLFDAPFPDKDGVDLWGVYLVWIGVVLFLYPICYWYMGLKRRSRSALLSYL
jgi:uncharacterized membrane protein